MSHAIAEKRFFDETDRRRDACRWSSVRKGDLRMREQRREPWRAARNVNGGRASRAARRGIAGRMWPAGRRLVTPDLN